MGGRNQEFALVSALELVNCGGLYMLSAGSDGSDGPTSAAGAFADGTTISKSRALGLDPLQALRNNDSYNFFKRLGNLFCPGPTGTNVLDFKIILLY
jgi:glycerate-2-kinase